MQKIVIKWSRLTALALFALCLVFGTAIAPARAEGPPAIPCNFYGYAYINGALAANGKVIIAQIGGIQVGTTTVSATTGRNYSLTTTGGTDGASVVFFIDGVQATPTSVYSSGGYVLLNLSTYTATLGVTTGSATGIFSTAALLAGTLTGLGASPTVNVYFDYGLTTSYGSTTTMQAMSATGGFTAGITGLAPGTTYHFRAKATDGASTVNGLDATFTTTTPVLSVVTGSAAGITTSTATLSGTLSDMGSYSGVNVSFDYGTTTSYGGATGVQSKTSTGAFAATVSSLTPGTTYHFRAKATGGSSTVYGSDVTFTTSSQTGGCTSGCCQWFYGTAYLNGAPVTSGTVAGLVNGVQTATTTLNTGGGFNFYVPVTAGSMVTFTVNGLTAAESATGQCMGVNNNFNLHTSSGTVTVTTGSGTYATTTTANLNGTLASLGSDSFAMVSFDWGTSTSYGFSTTPFSVVSLGGFGSGITGLTVGQTYHFRAKAVGSPSGTIVYGSDNTYVHNAGGTLSVTTGSGSYASSTTATLSSTLAGLASDSSATCYIDYGLSTSYGSSTSGIVLTSTGGYSGTASGLTSGQTYHIRGRVVGSPSGTTALGSDVTYVHSPGGTLAVSTGSGVYAGTTSATLNGTLSSLGSYSSAYVSFVYGPTSSYGSETSQVLMSSTGAFSATLTGLTSGQVVYFNAKAIGNAIGATPVYGTGSSYTHTPPSPDCLGSTSGNLASTVVANTFVLGKFQATCATITKINLRSQSTGNAMVALYQGDSSYNIGAKMYGDTSTTAVSYGVNVFTVPAQTLTVGNYYWLGWWTDANSISGLDTGAATDIYAYKVTGASFSFPTTVTDMTTGTRHKALISASN